MSLRIAVRRIADRQPAAENQAAAERGRAAGFSGDFTRWDVSSDRIDDYS